MESLHSGQYLTFTLGDDSFAIPIEHVLEVLEIEKITRVPRTADYLLGVINVRGSIRPIVDLRTKLNLPPMDRLEDEAYNIIILELFIDNETNVIGIVTDMVDQVVTLKEENIDPAPKIGTRLNRELISGIGKIRDLFLIILDTDYLFSENATNLKTMALPSPAK
ncbi:chemotaxis protein CheW [Spirochaeta isovalerica]|uniref:Purine-binding chemotaxis protein CheW n=1 Tax=Spirochaeta isovalerica TaxID=150 RepID=A0A841R810_9SPIO|nr:chemotaxis protein CheW [Spirochaeta isovalerica]MBB6478612.1 purine-binding chemotaxis protein CheW [Spirochaeta isovalerica]